MLNFPDFKNGHSVQQKMEWAAWRAECRCACRGVPGSDPTHRALRSGLLSYTVLFKPTRRGGWHQDPFPRSGLEQRAEKISISVMCSSREVQVWSEHGRRKPCFLPGPCSPTCCSPWEAICKHLGGCSVSAWRDSKAVLKLSSQFTSDLERSYCVCWWSCSWCISIRGTKPFRIGKVIWSVRTCMKKYKYFIRTTWQIILRLLIPHFVLLKTCC